MAKMSDGIGVGADQGLGDQNRKGGSDKLADKPTSKSASPKKKTESTPKKKPTAKIAKIAATNTPAGVGDRIPPRIEHSVRVDISGEGPVELSFGGVAGAGAVTINGAATHTLTKSETVKLVGTTQTSAGKAGKAKLVAKHDSAQIAASNGFTICAIPTRVTVAFGGLITGPKLGIEMTTSNDSDSGQIADLDKVKMSELVQYKNGKGCFAGITSGNNSGYLPASNTPHGTDSHGTPKSLLTGVGSIEAYQVFVFKDKRSGVTDIPVKNSGFVIKRKVTDDGTGKLSLETSKAGVATTVKGKSASAGSGSATKTQAV